jgi:hypothetical protein
MLDAGYEILDCALEGQGLIVPHRISETVKILQLLRDVPD